MKKEEMITSELYSLIKQIYLDGYIVEKIPLNEIIETYSIKDVVKVIIGLGKDMLTYVIEEPDINENIMREVFNKIHECLISSTNCINQLELDKNTLDERSYVFLKINSNYGPLTPLILDSNIEDISISENDRRIYVIHSRYSWYGWLKTNIVLKPETLDRIILAFSRKAGKHISLIKPLVEGTYEGKTRISAIYSDMVSRTGSSLVIRRKTREEWTITRLINEGIIDSVTAAYLWLVLENKGWIIIAGQVGAGKTTLTQALLNLVPPTRKVIIIEDVPELHIIHGLWESLVEKNEVFGITPEISSYKLLKFALRRRPDYVVIGEVRGVEARLLVQASRLGHGVLNTIHADSPVSVLQRLTAPPISIPLDLLDNIWCIVMIGLVDNKKRKVLSVHEVGDGSKLIPICIFTNENNSCDISEILKNTYRFSKVYKKDELYSKLIERALFLERLVSSGVFDLNEFSIKLLDFYNRNISGKTGAIDHAKDEWAILQQYI
ncbi:MAG: type II/IV secretion system ATPase subunit [Desulfurococcaceae archaeon]